MKRNTVGLFQIAVFAGLSVAASAQAELVRNPTQVGSNIDVGQVVKGTVWDENTAFSEAKGQVITRTGVYLTESGTYDDRLTVRLSIGGLFWYSLPEGKTFQARTVKFGPGVGQATGIYAFGPDPKKPTATLQFGLFSHKYSDAANLGEYLYRSGTYPGVLYSGGWSYINSASYMAQGARLTVPMLDGKLRHDFTFYMERGIEPTHNITPGYMVTYKPANFFEVGAGGVWSHGIPLKPDRMMTPKAENNRYSKTTERPTQGDPNGWYRPVVDTNNTVVGSQYIDPSQRFSQDSLGAYVADVNGNFYEDASNPGTYFQGKSSPCQIQAENALATTDCDYYTFKGFKVAARAALDIGMLIGSEAIKPGEFKLYSEIALLGVEDQPYFYEDKMARMPVMVGLNFPTFGLLDRLAGEVEYLKSDFANTQASAFVAQRPLPINIDEEDAYTYASPGTGDDLKWTVYAKRRIIGNVNVYAQAANDHQRHMSFKVIPSYRPFTERRSDWYYVLRLEFGI